MTDSKLPLAERLREMRVLLDRAPMRYAATASENCDKAADLIDQQHEALKAWEAWEAEWILNGNWDHGHVLMRDADMEALTPIQQLRNQAIAAAEDKS